MKFSSTDSGLAFVLLQLPPKCPLSTLYQSSALQPLFQRRHAFGFKNVGRFLALRSSHRNSELIWNWIEAYPRDPYYQLLHSSLPLERDALLYLHTEVAPDVSLRTTLHIPQVDSASYPLHSRASSPRTIFSHSCFCPTDSALQIRIDASFSSPDLNEGTAALVGTTPLTLHPQSS